MVILSLFKKKYLMEYENNNETTTSICTESEFYKKRVATHMVVSDEFLKNAELSVGYSGYDFIANRLTFQLRTFVWCQDMGEVIFSAPENWWEAFKERWFFKWMLRRWPVKYDTVYANKFALFPNYNPAVDSEYRIKLQRKL
jgi:hypothetical protein